MTPSRPTILRRWLPPGATPDAGLLLGSRGVRALGDGFVSILLPLHLQRLGFSGGQIGLVVTATLLGSAALTLLVGLVAYRMPRRRLLIQVSILMLLTGLGFAFLESFWPLMVVAFVGTINPSAGDVSVFLPTEQTLLPHTVGPASRTSLFARYTLIGLLLGAIGALLAGFPELLEARTRYSLDDGIQLMFLLYSALAIEVALIYRHLSPAIEPETTGLTTPLGESRSIVYRLAALFSLDSFAGGFVVQSMLALWLFERFGLSVSAAAAIFFWTGLLSAGSQLLAPRVASHIGLIRTMVYTHLPANILLMLTPLMPTLPLAITLLMARSLLSSMDVPARQSYVMAVVTPAERPAAASVTNVPRSLAAAMSPALSGWMLSVSTFGWPLLIAGSLKATYDLLLLHQFRGVKPPEEQSRT